MTVIGLITGCFQQVAPKRDVEAFSMAEASNLRETVEFINLARISDPVSFPVDLETFPKLSKLSVRGQKGCASVPEGIGQLTNLTFLDLSETGVSSLPDSFGALSGLRHLYLANNGMTNFPVSACALQGLTYLNFDRNAVTSLPEEVRGLAAVKWVRLNYNNLQALPEGAAEWKQIREALFARQSFGNFSGCHFKDDFT